MSVGKGKAGGGEVGYLARYVCRLLADGSGGGIGCQAVCKGGGWMSNGIILA
jgi:hypothetical protein